MKVGRVALDGTKIKANASKHKAMSYDRMAEKQKQLKAEVKLLLETSRGGGREEDAHYGRDRTGDELPAELERRRRGAERSGKPKAPWRKSDRRRRPRAAIESRRNPKKDQYNFTDPESRIMKGAG